MEIFLLTIILILCIFNAVSIFVVGGAVARNTENIGTMASVMTSVPKQTQPRGRRYDPESQLEDIKTEPVLREPSEEDIPELQS
jgi:hypothetical protein